MTSCTIARLQPPYGGQQWIMQCLPSVQFNPLPPQTTTTKHPVLTKKRGGGQKDTEGKKDDPTSRPPLPSGLWTQSPNTLAWWRGGGGERSLRWGKCFDSDSYVQTESPHGAERSGAHGRVIPTISKEEEEEEGEEGEDEIGHGKTVTIDKQQHQQQQTRSASSP